MVISIITGMQITIKALEITSGKTVNVRRGNETICHKTKLALLLWPSDQLYDQVFLTIFSSASLITK
jgi:hypothetical protein